MPKNKLRILCTSNLDASLVKKLEVNGMICDTIPFIRISYEKDYVQQREITLLLNEKITAVFTSKHAIEAVGKIKGIKRAPWKIYCTGSSTARLAANTLTAGSIVGTAENAASLAELILETEKGPGINFFCGDQRRDELPSIVGKKLSVREWIVYKTLLTPVKIEKEYDGILFLSPSAVKSFFSLNEISSSTLLFAIGKTTAAEIKEYCENRMLTGNETSTESLVNKLIEQIYAVKSGDI
jgi:uroporphyrinogen-III synthase